MPGLVLTMAGETAFGAYGKIPALGDFFRFGLAPDFIAAWDRWLQAGIPAARMGLGERWQGAYMSAPIWRFTLAPGVAGRAGAEGVLMASVDRVGRQFPLTLARALPAGCDPVASHLAAGERFAALETVALSALDDGGTQARLQQDLAGIGGASLPAAAVQAAPGFLGLCAPDPGPDPGAALAAALARSAFPRAALFTALLAEGEALVLTDGLPPPDRFRHLIDPDACGRGQP
ncbi:type VI secretion system-associated protein TagF [Pseudogemmobacter humi]|uniref:Type VI secretion-associated protein, BMA_A0400 family n=1 Tax=Pseudogemmobacter humi TaxID=2483812 RepID=A0A3P5XEZ1_9RHOB|nr:type VI secretion system-associated protein TagF [Pseudogemmobacter humi]VDC33324.1 hypothetical protein XINFAN_03772 [Pseudogemmobacter humi]